jgi:SOS response regulatory protein OraA/RecX
MWRPKAKEGVSPTKVSAKAKALAWLTRREYSEAELLERLLAYGYPDDQATAAIHWLQTNGWQSNQRFAESLARRRSGNYGIRYIRSELKQHSIEGVAASQALNELQSEVDRAYAWLSKRYRSYLLAIDDATDALDHESANRQGQRAQEAALSAKMFRALLSRGFEPDDAKQAITRFKTTES